MQNSPTAPFPSIGGSSSKCPVSKSVPVWTLPPPLALKGISNEAIGIFTHRSFMECILALLLMHSFTRLLTLYCPDACPTECVSLLPLALLLHYCPWLVEDAISIIADCYRSIYYYTRFALMFVYCRFSDYPYSNTDKMLMASGTHRSDQVSMCRRNKERGRIR